jgi:hypothetical protein
LTDGEEVNIFSSDPLDTDTDGDGLLDGAEVDIHLTQPAVADTDGDGLEDGDEILVYDIDPLDPDVDNDGLLDGDEILTYETDPYHRDTDLDGLSDGDEAFLHGTDPGAADSDGGGDNDAAEIGNDTDPQANIDDQVCAYATIASGSGNPGGSVIDPVYLEVTWEGIVNGGTFEDYQVVGAGRSARIFFSFKDGGKNQLCDVVYDLSTAAVSAAVQWTDEAGSDLYATYDLTLSGGDDNCAGTLDPAEFDGFTNLRSLIEAVPWGIGFGPLFTHAQALEDAKVDDGWDWGFAWEPFVFGAYLTMDRSTAFEHGYVLGGSIGVLGDCDEVDGDVPYNDYDPVFPTAGDDPADGPDPTLLGVPDDFLAEAYYETTALELLTLVEVLTFAQ